MTDPELFLRELRDVGFGVFSGVPCSYLTPLINTVIDSPEARYVGATNEGDAVAIACGAELGGTHGVVMFQNSGFGNAVSPLTSLTATLGIPVLVIVTWRGHPEQPADEPQHALMGDITPRLMDLIGIPWEPFPEQDDDVAPVLARACAHMRTHSAPFGLILKKGAVAPHALRTRPDLEGEFRLATGSPGASGGGRLDPDEALRAIQASVHDTDVVLATTGFTGRALYAQDDRPNQLYMVGSMGCVSSLGLGLAMAQPHRRVVVLDGDGAFLMRMGALATIGHERPGNLLHVLLDNAVHDSTGSQATVSPTVDPVAVARACGYPRAARVGSVEGLAEEVRNGPRELTFLHARTEPRKDRKLPRPDVTPPQVARRLKAWMGIE